MKIVIFDTWTNGLAFVNELATANRTVQFTYVHLDSLFLKNSKFEGYIAPNIVLLDAREFAYDFVDILKSDSYDHTVVLSIHSLQHRVWIRCANLVKIPVLFVPHGVRLFEPIVKNFWKRIGYYSGRLVFYTRLYKRITTKAFVQGALSLRQLTLTYIKMVFNYNHFKNYSIASLPFYVDTVFLANKIDEDYFRHHWFRDTKPIFVMTGHMKSSFVAYRASKFSEESESNLLLISQPEIISEDLFERVLVNIKSIYQQLAVGGKLIFRPHPRDTQINKDLAERLGYVISNNKEEHDLYHAKVVLGFNSAMLYAAMYSGKRILSLKIEGVPSLPGLESYHNYESIDILNLQPADVVKNVSTYTNDVKFEEDKIFFNDFFKSYIND